MKPWADDLVVIVSVSSSVGWGSSGTHLTGLCALRQAPGPQSVLRASGCSVAVMVVGAVTIDIAAR